MPLFNPVELRRLVAELEALETLPRSGDVERRREDLQYTLCVSTGVREPARALEQARHLLALRRHSLATAV